MKHIALLVVVVVALLSLHVWAESQERAERFLIHVSWDGERVVLACEKGCAWEDLSWGCNDEVPCELWIDESGMTENRVFEAVLSIGPYVDTIRLCGEKTSLQVSPVGKGYKALRTAYEDIAGEPYAHVFARVRGGETILISSRHGEIAIDAIDVREVLEVRPLAPGECDPK
jgi:hypothetical protein